MHTRDPDLRADGVVDDDTAAEKHVGGRRLRVREREQLFEQFSVGTNLPFLDSNSIPMLSIVVVDQVQPRVLNLPFEFLGLGKTHGKLKS